MWKNLVNLWRSNDLLKQAWDQSFEMLKIDQEMFFEAVEGLRYTNSNKINEDVRNKDKLINQYEQEVRKKVMMHCSINPAAGLAEGMALISIVIDIERIGDYTKNMVDLAMKHPKKLSGGIFEEDLVKIEAAVKDTFIKMREFLETSDQEKTMALIKKYKWVNPLCDTCMAGLIEQKDDTLSPGSSAALALYFRWLKRIYSHLRNIGTSIVNPFDKIGFKPKKKYLKV